jgi:inosine-uridine nucleoside N-ribohydrolase
MGRPVIIDCDTGTDDAIALLCAHRCKELDVIAITTVAGNTYLENTSQNTLNLVDYIDWDVPVAIGESKPLMRKLVTADCHGAKGFGDITLEKSNREFHPMDACTLIYEMAKKYEGQLEIVTIGPMTNMAMCLLRYPNIKSLIKRITFMGGAMIGGNTTLAAEFNIYADPEAAKIVFESGIPLTMVGLDVTQKAVLSPEDREYFNMLDNPHAKLTVKLLDYMFKRADLFGQEDAVMHDGLAVASLVLPDLLKTEKYYVTVETKGHYTTGQTIVDYYNSTRKEGNIDIAVDLDVDMFKEWVKQLITY